MTYIAKGTQIKIYMPGVTYLHEIGSTDSDGYTLDKIEYNETNHELQLFFLGTINRAKLKDIVKTIGRAPFEIIEFGAYDKI